MKKFNLKLFGNTLFGDPQTVTLEHRVFNAVTIITSLTGLITIIQNIAANNPPAHNIFSVITFVAGAAFYLSALNNERYKKLALSSVIFFMGLLSIAWFYTDGSEGTGAYYFFILFISAIILLPPPYNLVFTGLGLLIIGLLLLVEYIDPALMLSYPNQEQRLLDVGISVLVCLMITSILVYLVVIQYQRERAKNEQLLLQTLKDKEALEKVLSENKILKGFLPICANCKKIRDDEGYWHQVESYIMAHSEAEFSHGICPDCKAKLYAEFFSAHPLDSSA